MAQWIQTNGPGGGTVSTLTVKCNTFYAGTERGIFRSKDSGKTWEYIYVPLGVNVQVSSITFNDSLIFFATCGSGVFRSADNGKTWCAINNIAPTRANNVLSIIVHNNYLFRGTSAGDGIYRSTDNGETWTAINSGIYNIFGEFFILLSKGNNLFVGSDNGIYRTTNDGISWVEAGWEVEARSLAATDSFLFAGTHCGVYRSSDNGDTWLACNAGLIDYELIIHSIATFRETVFIGTEGGVFKSTNNGDTWMNDNNGLPIGTPWTYVQAMTIEDTTIVAGMNGLGIYRSPIRNVNWQASNSGFVSCDVRALTIDGDTIYAGVDGGGVHKTTNCGETWKAINTDLAIPFIRAVHADGALLHAASNSGVYRSTDYGGTWWFCPSGLPSIPYVKSLAKSGPIILAGTDYGVYRSTNGGLFWESSTTKLEGDAAKVYNFLVTPSTTYAGTTYGVFQSIDEGDTWTKVGTSVGYAWSLAIIDTFLFAGSFGGGVYRTTLNECDWVQVSNGLSGLSRWIHALISNGKTLFSGSFGEGIYASYDYGNCWTAINSGFPEGMEIRSLVIDNVYLYAGTSRRGVWRRPLSEISTVEPAMNTIPQKILLEQNYPNPFNPTTNLQFTIANVEFVKIKVFDVLGRDVATLINEEKQSGIYTVQWNASNQPSGVYFCRLEAGNFVRTIKLILLK